VRDQPTIFPIKTAYKFLTSQSSSSSTNFLQLLGKRGGGVMSFPLTVNNGMEKQICFFRLS
jgi:hypothetical protein